MNLLSLEEYRPLVKGTTLAIKESQLSKNRRTRKLAPEQPSLFDIKDGIANGASGNTLAIVAVHGQQSIKSASDFDNDVIEDGLLDCSWSRSVALDPKHRPQVWDEPSSTVRREWCRFPQEAHLLDSKNSRYRRLSLEEMAIIQGFDPSWFNVPNVTRRNQMKAIGDAVPPPLSKAILTGINDSWTWTKKSALEICAGSGGLASGTAVVPEMEHVALFDSWGPACSILRHDKPWKSTDVHECDVKSIDFTKYRNRVGILSGGPPCQPWSLAGQRRGVEDQRDLLGSIHHVVAQVQPEVFLFENVPGLSGDQHRSYFDQLLTRLRSPSSDGPRYGVVAGLLIAADFGVPQLRRRLFILGFREEPNSFAYKVFDRIYSRATHRDPSVPHPTRKRWVTLREAFQEMPDPGGWKKWV